jgi:hypothetical protein
MSADSIRLYEELTGVPLSYQAGTPNGRLLFPAERQECERVTLVSQSDSMPAPVRERLAAEAERVQREREEREREERAEQERHARELRERAQRRAAAEREVQERNHAYEQMMSERRRRLHEENQDRLRREREEREREDRELAAYDVTCAVFKCGEPGRLYPNGSHVPIARCRYHEPHHMWIGANGRVVTGEPLKPVPLESLSTQLADRTG